MKTEHDSIYRDIVTASKWSMLTEFSSKMITPIVFLILARLLAPEDFGLVAFATMLINFVQILWDSGLSKALIQKNHREEACADIVFISNILLGILFYIVLFLLSNRIALIFDDYRIADVLRIQGLQIPLASIASVQAALFQQKMDFKSLFRSRIYSTIFSALLSIALALIGFGYWALVAGAIGGVIVRVWILWKLNPWRPRWRFEIPLAKELWKFGAWVLCEELLVWFFQWGDSFIVGAYLGTHTLGLYHMGNLIVLTTYGILMGSLMPVIFSSFSKIKRDPLEANRLLINISKSIIILAFPIGAGFMLLKDPIEYILLDRNWEGIGIVIGILGLGNGLAHLVGAFPSYYRAMGHPDTMAKLKLINICYALPVYLIFINDGLEVFLWARFSLIIVGMLLHLLVAGLFFSIRIDRFLFAQKFIIISTLLMSFLLLPFNHYYLSHLNAWLNLLFALLFSTIIYISSLYKEKNFIVEVIRMALPFKHVRDDMH